MGMEYTRTKIKVCVVFNRFCVIGGYKFVKYIMIFNILTQLYVLCDNFLALGRVKLTRVCFRLDFVNT